MDQKELQKKIAEYYLKLPTDAQITFASMKWMETLKKINTKYTLVGEDIKTLGTETTLVLLGIISTEQYVKALKEEISLPEDSITKMIGEVEDSVLKGVRSELDQTYALNLRDAEKAERKLVVDPKFETLPKEVQEAIAESDYQKKLYGIGTKHKLQIEKMGKLEDITVKFINGKLSPSQYENTLGLEMDLEAEKVKDIATDVNELILKNIREYMKRQSEELKTGFEDKDDEIPKPPYADAYTKASNPQTPASDPSQNKTPEDQKPIILTPVNISSMYEDSGIEIIVEEKKEPSVVITENKLDKLITREVKSELTPKENTFFKSSGIDILKEKLEGITVSKNTVSDHDLSKISRESVPEPVKIPTPPVKTHDPYHEAIDI